MSLKLGVGVSSEANVYAAGQEAARQVMSHLSGQAPDLLLVFSAVRFADPRLLKGVRSVAGEAPLIGCTDAGGISTSGPQKRCVTVVGVRAPEAVFRVGIGRGISREAQEAGHMLGESFLAEDIARASALLMLPDGLAGNGAELLEAVQRSVGPNLPIVGGAAADDFEFQKTFQYFGEEILTDSVPGVLIGGGVRVGMGVRHGWMPVGRPRRVTRATGNIIEQLDGKPAVSIYEEYLGTQRQEIEQEGLPALAINYPLGTEVPGRKEYLLRDALKVGASGSLVCTAGIAEGSSVRLMIGGYESALEAAQEATQEAVRNLNGAHVQGALVFCSVARQKMLGSEFHGEIDVIRDALGGTGMRMGGFYTYGEQAPWASTKDLGNAPSAFHNESVVVMALA